MKENEERKGRQGKLQYEDNGRMKTENRGRRQRQEERNRTRGRK